MRPRRSRSATRWVSPEAEALARSATTEFESYVKLNKKVPPEVVGVVQQIEDYAKLADMIAAHLALKIPDRQAILETTAVNERLEKVLGLMKGEDVHYAGRKTHQHPRQAADREDPARVFLNEQKKAIQKELGDEEGRDEFTEMEEDQEDQALEGCAREGDPRAQEASADIADVGGRHRRAQLPRLAAVDPVE